MSDLAVDEWAFTTDDCLQDRAVAVDAASDSRGSLADLWSELVQGRASVVTHFLSADRCFLILQGNANAQNNCLDERSIEILRRTLLGEAQKVVAMDFRLSTSAVADTAKQALHSIGLNCTATRAPVPVVMAAHAQLGETEHLVARESVLESRTSSRRVMSVALPDDAALNPLTDAERSIVRLVFERRTNAEIAFIRTTSERTVANQLASVFRKLGAGSRGVLVSRLIAALPAREAALQSVAPPPESRERVSLENRSRKDTTSSRLRDASDRPPPLRVLERLSIGRSTAPW